jgi:hypothetical protein
MYSCVSLSNRGAEFDGWQKEDPIPDANGAVSWCDGDLSQIATIVTEESLEIYCKHKICANKQNAARSAAEQPADLTRVFKLMHRLIGLTT